MNSFLPSETLTESSVDSLVFKIKSVSGSMSDVYVCD